VWVNSALAGKSVLYDGNGVPNSLVVSIPAATGGGQGIPTGIVFSSSNDFAVTNGVASGPSRFIFASLTGSISGWAPNVDLTNALIAVDRSAQGASYTGLALAANGTGNLLYATTCARPSTSSIAPRARPLPGGFRDPDPPGGSSRSQSNRRVTRPHRSGKQNADGNFVPKGLGSSACSTQTVVSRRLARLALNAPAGQRAGGFGRFSNRLRSATSATAIRLDLARAGASARRARRRASGSSFRFWGMAFGNGLLNQPTDVLLFAAGEFQTGLGSSPRRVALGHEPDEVD
jgi:uncharacterized protein (TIGR03118 family)